MRYIILLLCFLLTGCPDDPAAMMEERERAERERKRAAAEENESPVYVMCRTKRAGKIRLRGPVAIDSGWVSATPQLLRGHDPVPVSPPRVAAVQSGCDASMLEHLAPNVRFERFTHSTSAQIAVFCGTLPSEFGALNIDADRVILYYFLHISEADRRDVVINTRRLELVGDNRIETRSGLSYEAGDLNISISESVTGQGRLWLASTGYSCLTH